MPPPQQPSKLSVIGAQAKPVDLGSSSASASTKASSVPKRTTAPHSLAPKKPPTQVHPRSNSTKPSQPSQQHPESEPKPEPEPNTARSASQSEPTATTERSRHIQGEPRPEDQNASQQPPLPLPIPTTTLTKIPIKSLMLTLDPILNHPTHPLTPLILDPTGRIDIFFQYAGEFAAIPLDAKKLLVETLVHKRATMESTLEMMRQTLVAAMKHGRTLHISMLDSAADLLHRFTSPTEFPAATVLAQGGRLMYDEQHFAPVVRDADMRDTGGVFVVRPGFQVVVTSLFDVEDYKEFLKVALPVDEMAQIFILPGNGEQISDNSHAQVSSELAGYSA